MIKRIRRKIKAMWRQTPVGRIHKSTDAIRWGILGTGYMARTFANTIRDSKTDVLVAVGSRDIAKATAFARNYYGCRPYGSYSHMLEDKNIDVVYIATPLPCHYENAMMCLDAGYNVICEKPITDSLVQLCELESLAKRNRVFLMEGMWMKCLPTFHIADSWIKEGQIGEIVGCRADLYKRNETSGTARKSALLDFGVYPLAFVLNFMPGSVLKHSASCSDTHGIDTDWNLLFRDGEKIGVVNISNRFSSLSKAVVIGSKGSIEWDSQFNRTNRIALFDANGKLVKQVSFSYENEGFEYELREVSRCVKAGLLESEIVSVGSSRQTVKVIDELKSQYGL